MSPTKDTQESAESGTASKKANEGFSDEELAAMKERSKEVKKESRRGKGEKADPETEVLAKIAEMPESDRVIAERLHAIVRSNAPGLAPKLWYGMPAYAKDGKVVCFFQAADKFSTRYATFGFNDTANLDDGRVWPVAFAIKELTAADEAKVASLVKQAVS